MGWRALAGSEGRELGGSAGHFRNGLCHLFDDTFFHHTKHLGMRQSPLLGVTDLASGPFGVLLFLLLL